MSLWANENQTVVTFFIKSPKVSDHKVVQTKNITEKKTKHRDPNEEEPKLRSRKLSRPKKEQ